MVFCISHRRALPDLLQQAVPGERLLLKRDTRSKHAVLDDRVIRIARHINYLLWRKMGADHGFHKHGRTR